MIETIKCGCGADCAKKDGTCQGEVLAVDDIDYGGDVGYEWYHLCTKHEKEYNG